MFRKFYFVMIFMFLTVAFKLPAWAPAESVTFTIDTDSPLTWLEGVQELVWAFPWMANTVYSGASNIVDASNKPAPLRGKNNKGEEYIVYDIPQTGFEIKPIGSYTNQRLAWFQPALKSGQYGAAIAWNQVLKGKFILENTVGYTHQNTTIETNIGNIKASNLWVQPFFGWFNQKAFANISLMGNFQFNRAASKLFVPGFGIRYVRGRFTTYNIAVRASGGPRIQFKNSYWFQPETTLAVNNYITSGFSNTIDGQTLINFNTTSNSVLFSRVLCRFIKQYENKKICYAPNISLGWAANTPLNRVRSTGNVITFPQFGLKLKSRMINQLVVGAQFYAQKFNKFILTGNFTGYFLSKSESYNFYVRYEWLF